MAFITDLLAAVPFLNKLGRKKPFILWYEGPDRAPFLLSKFVILREGSGPGAGWIKKSGPMSHRQCVHTRDVLGTLGQ